MTEFTHFDNQGQAHMVDVGKKDITHRIAIASGRISMQQTTLSMIEAGNHKKGDVLSIARIAGIMASKRGADLIPLCHPLMLTKVSVEFETHSSGAISDSGSGDEYYVSCTAQTEVHAKTGVEIEALLAVQTALLTIYDMCKAVDRSMVIGEVKLEHKSGGASGDFNR